MPLALVVLLRTLAAVLTLVALTRLTGLRSFSKMSGFDFAITVAMGSVLASIVTTAGDASVAPGFLGLGSLFLVQFLLSRTRAFLDPVETVLDNRPLLVLEHGEVLEHNLRAAGMTKADLVGKLREANALRIEDVRAVVFEPTGDVSVLHHAEHDVDEQLLEGVRR